MSDLKQHSILLYYSREVGKLQIGSGKDIIYYPSNEMTEYFAVKPSTKFVDLDGYLQLVGKSNEKIVRELLSELGVYSCPKIIIVPLNLPYPKYNYSWSHSTGNESWSESYIDGCIENYNLITKNNDQSRSLVLWNMLLIVPPIKPCRNQAV